MLWKSSLFLLALLVLPACELGLLSPKEAAPSQVVSHGLVTQLSVDRAAIERGEEFGATFWIRNTRSEPIHLESLCNALARGVVYRNGHEVGFIGSGSGCRTAISTYNIAAGETLKWQWQVKAAIILRAYPDGREPDMALAEPGQYIFQVEPDVYRINGAEAQLPKMEQRILVR